MKSVHCEGLKKCFGGVRALAGVTVDFPDSGITAIIGPNGAGKTTLINVLTGFLTPDSGKFFYGEHELTGLPPHQIVRRGVVRSFQDLRLISQLSVLENVMLARPKQRGERLLPALLRIGVAAEEDANREESMRWLKFVGIDHAAHQLAGELSYGQQKLLALSCCLATEAELLLLDEPVTGVHPEMISKILELLCRLRESGRRVIFIEHDISAVRSVADVVLVMDHGQIIAQGNPKEVLERPEIMEAYVG